MNVSNASRPRRSYDRDASRRAIVDAAMRQFAEHGFAATRVEDVVEAAGYTRGAFYFHFENKLECFWAVVEHREELRGDWVAAVTAGLDPATTTLPEVLTRMFVHFAQADQGVSAWVLAMVDFFQQHRDESDVQARLAEVYAGWHRNVTRFVRALQEGGWVARDRDAAALATQLFAAAEGLQTHARLYSLDPAATQPAMIELLVTLLRG